ncbi:MAG: ABC transporter substrate-binding protein [Candidatus Aminicenantes bacterium]|nr:ABC transporter substrate-binding protein [Candidatus Aminicenantes bacterium]
MNMKRKAKFYLILTLLPVLLSAEKIVSLAPAVTEIIFALGKGDRIIGNTQFCDFPEAAGKIPKVGAKLDLNLEVLISMQPDIIFLYPSYYEKVKILEKRSKLVVVNHANLQGLYDSIKIIAGELQVVQKGSALLANIKNTFAAIREKTKNKKKIKTLLIAGRNIDQLRNMYIIGRKDFLNDILEIAGGINVYKGDIDYPNISVESVVGMNPDFIIELSVFYQQIDEKKVKELWGKYHIIKAVRNNNIKVIKDNVWLRPGPRVGQIARKLHRMFFPEEGDS